MEPESPLEQAERHVIEGEQRVAAQRELLSRLRADGYPTLDAQEILERFEKALELMREHLAFERAKMDDKPFAVRSRFR